MRSASVNTSSAQSNLKTKQSTANKQIGTNIIVTKGTAIRLTKGETVDIYENCQAISGNIKTVKHNCTLTIPDRIAVKEKPTFLTGQRQKIKQIMITAEKLSQKLSPNILNGKSNIKQLSPNKIKLLVPICLLHIKKTVNKNNINHALSVGKPKPAKAE